jgi:3-oxoacyl-[acyl-carrier-protein] synthase-1
MSKIETVISSVGMITSIGNNAEQTAANVRAGISRYGETPMAGLYHKQFTLALISRDALGEIPETMAHRKFFTRREGLLLRIAGVALRDCMRDLKIATQPPLFLALPEHETAKPLAPASFLDDLSTLNGGLFNRAASRAEWKGRAGSLAALGAAAQAIAAGDFPCVIAGGVDTFYDPYVLAKLDSYIYPQHLNERPLHWVLRVKREHIDPIDPFIPGEGGGLLLLANKDFAAAQKLPLLAKLSATTSGFEPGYHGSTEPYKGEGLAETVQQLLEQNPPPSAIREVYSTMNGESYWAKEWGVTRVRNAQAFADGEIMHHPAEFFGDVGAASGPILVGLAASAISKNDRLSPALVYASSDYGPRAAGLVTALTST